MIRISVSDSLRDVAMATDFGKIYKMTFIQHAGVSKRNTDSKISNGNTLATFCVHVKISPVTLKIMKVEIVIFGTVWQKLAFPTEYL